MGKKYMRQYIHEYTKTLVYRLVVNSKEGLRSEKIKEKLSGSVEPSEEIDACMNELKDDGLLAYDSGTDLWTAT
jgi:hypothetical protein